MLSTDYGNGGGISLQDNKIKHTQIFSATELSQIKLFENVFFISLIAIPHTSK